MTGRLHLGERWHVDRTTLLLLSTSSGGRHIDEAIGNPSVGAAVIDVWQTLWLLLANTSASGSPPRAGTTVRIVLRMALLAVQPRVRGDDAT
jgi:hypothetical protein